MDTQEKNFAILCHALAFVGLVIPFGNIIAPLVLWLMKKDVSPVVASQGLESLNFQITVTLASLVGLGLMVVGIGFLLLPVIGIGAVVLVVLAIVEASKGGEYRYPVCLRLVK